MENNLLNFKFRSRQIFARNVQCHNHSLPFSLDSTGSGQRAHIYGLAGEDSGINASGAGVPFNILNICFKSCERGGLARIKDSI